MLFEKLFCSFFNPLISLYIYYDQYEKIWRKNKQKFPRFVSMEMAAIFDVRALTKVGPTYNFKTVSSNFVEYKKSECFKEVSLCIFLEYYSIMMHRKLHSILPKKWPRKWDRNMTFSSKMHNGEKAFEVLLYLGLYIYTMQASHKRCAFLCKWVHFGNMSYMYGKFDHFSAWKCQQIKIH